MEYRIEEGDPLLRLRCSIIPNLNTGNVRHLRCVSYRISYRTEFTLFVVNILNTGIVRNGKAKLLCPSRPAAAELCFHLVPMSRCLSRGITGSPGAHHACRKPATLASTLSRGGESIFLCQRGLADRRASLFL